MMHGLYTALAVTAVGTVFGPAALARRVLRGAPTHLRARLGYGGPAPTGLACGWLHAVSVGEAIAAGPILEGLRRAYPELPLVMTTVTETGARVVRERYAGLVSHRFLPLDLPGPVRRFVSSLDPAFLICIETELWPNLLRALARRGVPVMIANGRLSDRSFRRYRAVRGFMRTVLGHVRVFGMQSAEDARRVIALGATPERVVVTGNIKHEAAPEQPGVAELWQRLLGLRPDQLVWIAGSTHRGEDESVLDAHAAVRDRCGDVALVLAPRHPERVPEVVDLIQRRGFTAVRRSELPRHRSADAVIVLDTVGELAQLYAVADVVFVGGSLVPAGGHNMLEPALRRKPVVFGPYTANFREAAALVADHGGIVVRDGTELREAVCGLLPDPARRHALGQAAYEAVAARHGAVRETLDLIDRFLCPRAAV